MPEGERKTVTALFADIKGSTELMRDLDPEEARAIIDPALKLMIDAVASLRRLRRAIDRRRHLCAVRRAGRTRGPSAAGAVRRAADAGRVAPLLARRLVAAAESPSKARVGINTGEVVMRTGADRRAHRYSPVGHAINLASRMQTVAPAGGVVVSEDDAASGRGLLRIARAGPDGSQRRQ